METVVASRTSASSDVESQEACATLSVMLAVPHMMCGGCVRTIEQALLATPGVGAARANLGARRVFVTFTSPDTSTGELIGVLKNEGFSSAELADDDPSQSARSSGLLARVGVAGFAAANIMLLSVSVWSGHASDMDSSVATLFHWLSALIALPAIGYAAQPFFASAYAALRSRRVNMDVPISLGITLATAMSLFQTMRGTDQVYFDAAVTLVFFLLIGRTLDERMRVKSRGAAENLMSLKAVAATVIGQDGVARQIQARNVVPGMRMIAAAGERIAADGIITSGRSEIDESLITGETLPRIVQAGDRVHAGTVNGAGTLQIEATSTDENTLLAEIARLMLAGEQSRGRYVRLADRAARMYAPAVHVLGLATFIGWMVAGGGWEQALTYAIAVLIITCPCALALAVPAVQVAATSRLFGQGTIVKAADGLERLSEVDTIVFDKTGTLTMGELHLSDGQTISDDILVKAAGLAVSSRHPYAQAIVREARARGLDIAVRPGVQEVAGSGLVVAAGSGEVRLGSAAWTGVTDARQHEASLWFVQPGREAIGFRFEDRLRSDAVETVAALKAAGYAVELLSGDRPDAVEAAARAAGFTRWQGGARPDAKLHRLQTLKDQGHRTLMVGDGLNDAPALATGHASLSPATAVDISQTAADAVFQGDRLAPVVETLKVARASHRMSLQNFAIAILYNMAFVPLAMAGYVTPLVAAIAMSTSSIIVTANAVRLRTMKLALPPVVHDKQQKGGSI
ncbi:MAG: heavy metal translocating P-type ATPase [Hyphomicrobium sp.]|nr:heavy metal translocating P-type ATPase [Hyphomicrobium sp.]